MHSWSPTVEGFRTLFRKPALPLAEIAWRWSFGAAAFVLCICAMAEYLDSLPVSGRNLLLLRSAHPALVSHALSQIVRGSGVRVVLAASFLLAGLTLLWILLASIGRAATMKPMLESIRDRVRHLATLSQDVSPQAQGDSMQYGTVRSMAGLSFLRAALGLATILSGVGAVVVGSLLSTAKHPHPALAFFVFASFAFATAFSWIVLNWFLSIASMFVGRDGQDTFGALTSAERLVRERFGAVFAVSSWFGLAHLTLFVLATSAVGLPLSLAPIVPPGFILAAMLLITLIYFAIVDSLYVGRLAGYAAILEAPVLQLRSALPQGLGHRMPDIQAASAMVEQDDLILSDQPQPAASLMGTEHPQPLSALQPERAMVDQNELILGDERSSELPAPSVPRQDASLPPSSSGNTKP